MRHGGEQRLRVGVLRALEDVEGGALLNGDAVFHHHDRVGQVGDDAHVVRDEHDGRVEPRAQVAQQLEDLRLHRDVEGRGRLVGDEKHGVARDGLRDHRALPLPARQLVGELVEGRRRVGHVDLLEQLDRALLRLRRREVVVRAQRLDDLEADGVDGVQGRHRLLEDHGDLLTAHPAQLALVELADLAAEQLDRPCDARGRRQEAEQGHRARRLARARLAHDSHDLAALDGVVEAHGRRVELAVDPEVDAQARDLQNGLDGGAGAGAHGSSFRAVMMRVSEKLELCASSQRAFAPRSVEF